MPNLPYTLYFYASLVIVLLTGMIHLGTQKGMIPMEMGRKALHLSAILVCAYVIAHTDAHLPLAFIFFGAAALLFYITSKNILLPNDRKSYGIALFPIAFGILLMSPLDKSAVLFGVLTLGISDALAGLFGQLFAKRKIKFLAEYKSWLGFCVFYLSTLGIGVAFIGINPAVFLLALVPALTELFSYRGSDNLAVPIVAAAWFAFMKDEVITLHHAWLFVGLLAFGYFVLRKKWLTEAGATAAALLAVVIVSLCGLLYLVPLLVFFAAGSLASKLHAKPKEQSGRDAYQVFSNGLIPTLCVCAYAATSGQVYLLAYLASVCINLTDTISSDIGTWFRQKTYDILTFKPTPVGISGGVSMAGTLAGVVAAFCFAFFCLPIFELQLGQAMQVAILGIAGMVLDSVLGSRFQAKYLLEGREVESPLEGATLIKGWSWLQNDLVNLLSNAMVIVVYLIINTKG